MAVARIVIEDEVNVRIRGVDRSTIDDVIDNLSFHVPNYIFNPKYKLGRWDGRIPLCKPTGRTYLQLLDMVEPLLIQAGYNVVVEDERPELAFTVAERVDENYLSDCFMKGEPIVLRDYQVDAINTALAAGYGILQLATGAGKTLICGSLSKVFLAYGRVLVIVPSIDLAVQTAGVFKQLGVDAGIFYGEMKEFKQCIVTTWQSLENYPELFAETVAVIVDEAHQAKAKILNEILCGPGARVPYRFGVTGTIPKEQIYQYQLRAALGPTIFELHSWELQQLGVLATSHVNVVKLKDSKNPRYRIAREDHEEWLDEIKWMAEDDLRMEYVAEFIREIAKTGNTLVLTQYRVMGDALAERLGVEYIDGRMKASKRMARYEEIDSQDNQIDIASMKVASTGIDIQRLYNIVFICTGKAMIPTMQAIGRGLRKSKERNGLSAKTDVTIWDICGDASFENKQSNERRQIYKDANHPCDVIEVDYYDAHSE